MTPHPQTAAARGLPFRPTDHQPGDIVQVRGGGWAKVQADGTTKPWKPEQRH